MDVDFGISEGVSKFQKTEMSAQTPLIALKGILKKPGPETLETFEMSLKYSRQDTKDQAFNARIYQRRMVFSDPLITTEKFHRNSVKTDK